MTSWPEPPAEGQPPQTRRQARENERTAARQEARRAGTSEPTPGGEIPTFRTSASAAPTAQSETPAPQPARPAESAVSAPERPSIPATAFAEPGVLPPSRPYTANGGDFDSLVFSAPATAAPADTTASPDATTAPDDEDDAAASLFRQASDPAKPEAVTQPLAVVPTPDRPSAAAGVVPERTLTRREMRAMMQAQEANQQANHAPHLAEPVVPIAVSDAPSAPSGQTSSDAGSSLDAPVADGEKKAWPFAPLTPSSSGSAAQTPAPPVAAAPAAAPVQTSAPTSPFTGFGLTPSSAPTADPAPAPVPASGADDASAQERRPFTPPTGHWSTAAEVEEASEPIISRNVGQSTAATTTNALILPAIPRPDATAPLTSTGEILVTGSIDLPRGVGSTGLNPEHLDSSDIDNLLDGEENEFNTSEVAPVRASRAISTHTSTRGVITPPKKRGNALPLVLIITAGVLAVGVIGLLVAAYWLRVF